MFVVGLFIGPILGVVGAWLLMRWNLVRGFWTAVIALLVVLFLLFVPGPGLEVKLGLIAGLLLGLILMWSPQPLQTPSG